LAKVFLKKLHPLSFLYFLVPCLSLAWSWWRTRIGGRGASSGEPGSQLRVAFAPPLLVPPFRTPFMSFGSPEEALTWGAVPREVWVRLAGMCGLLAV
jgi:hypothetical protein